nr:MAG TPA: conjugal transfer protein [Caudoviricetes sp.]
MVYFITVLVVLWILSYGFTSILRGIAGFILALFGR